MPQKRNPISSCYIHAAISVVRQHAAALMDAMVADHERSTGPWEIEWIVLPEAFCLMAGALKQSRFVLEGLEVDATAMRRNIDLTHGLVMSEAVMMGLGPYIGREYAHDLVYDICREARRSSNGRCSICSPSIPRSTSTSIARALAKLCDPGQLPRPVRRDGRPRARRRCADASHTRLSEPATDRRGASFAQYPGDTIMKPAKLLKLLYVQVLIAPGPRHRRGPLLARVRRCAQAAGRRLRQAGQDDDRADRLLHHRQRHHVAERLARDRQDAC